MYKQRKNTPDPEKKIQLKLYTLPGLFWSFMTVFLSLATPLFGRGRLCLVVPIHNFFGHFHTLKHLHIVCAFHGSSKLVEKTHGFRLLTIKYNDLCTVVQLYLTLLTN